MLKAENVYGCITDLVLLAPNEGKSNRGRAIESSRLGANTHSWYPLFPVHLIGKVAVGDAHLASLLADMAGCIVIVE